LHSETAGKSARIRVPETCFSFEETGNLRDGILSTIGGTPLVRLRRFVPGAGFNLFAKLEALNPGGSIKDRPALAILEDALGSGVIGRDTLIIESSSGNMGIGLAQACRYYGLHFLCVVDPKTAAANLQILRAYGAQIDLVEQPDPETGEFLQARLNRVRELVARNGNAFWPNQYANQKNSHSHYASTMHEVAMALGGRVDFLFVATSTCGTIRGCSEYVRDHGLATRVIAVDARGSLIFSDVRAKRLVPGLGAGLRPPLCDLSMIDECVHVDDLDCIVGCRRLIAREAILAGGSSGGVLAAIEKVKDRIPDGTTCVAILPDRGERYLETLFCDEWVCEHFGTVEHLWNEDLVELDATRRDDSAADRETSVAQVSRLKEMAVKTGDGQPEAPALKSLGTVKRRAVTISGESLVRFGVLPTGELPLLAEPSGPGVNLEAWAASHRELLEQKLQQHGGILFRGFNLKEPEDLETFIRAVSGESLEYRERSSPRHAVKGNIYTSTDYPPSQMIFLHNENSYQQEWPLKIFFFCRQAPETGGETPIADVRKVLARISPEIRDRFAERRWMYVRNFGDGFGLSWHTVFQTTDKGTIERHCREKGIETEWKDGDRLRTRAVRQALARHPKTAELVWFNHATFFNVSTLDPVVRETLLSEFEDGELPTNTYYGDGSPIEPEVLDQLRAAYHAETVSFPWQHGDLLMLDNMLVAHGRAPYTGARQILVGMAEPVSQEQATP
jgi:2,3-diaminopropionate biosynthesis protein SbnA